MDFYHFFSFSAKSAIYRASEVCTQFNNQHLEPEHILYSILNLRSCSAVQVLSQLGVNLPKLTYTVEQYLYENAGSFKGTASFSSRTLTLLDNSFKEVKRLHHREIGTTHIMMALAQDRSPFLRELFTEHDLDAKQIRDTYMTHLKGFAASSWQPEDAATEPEYAVPNGPHAGPPDKEAMKTAASRAVQEQMFDVRLREILWLAAYLAKRLKHAAIEPAHVMYALSTREDGLKLIEDAYKLDSLKPSKVLVSLAGEMDKLPLSGDVPRQVPHGKLVKKNLTRAFESAIDCGALVVQFTDFTRLLLADTKKHFKPVLKDCELTEEEKQAAAAGSEQDAPESPGDQSDENDETLRNEEE